MNIKFCGAASSVTGSCHLITTEKHKVLLDCGQFQGGKAMEAMNWQDFGFDPAEIDCLILSHAHVDHCGRIPLLVKRGFKGKIYCTDATSDLVEVMLKDSGYIHEKEAEWKNRKAERAGKPIVAPLYTFNDAVDSLQYLSPILYDQLIEINEEMKIVFNDAGHILGSAIVELWVEEEGNVSKIVFSGDLGVHGRPILRDPTIIKKADYLIMETTYGNRLHTPNSTSIDDLINIVLKTTRRGGTVVIPSFAVGRTQELIFEFNRFYEKNSQYKEELDKLFVYVDSPMATTATEVFKKNAQVFDEETKEYILQGEHPLDFKNLKFTRSSEQSRNLNFDTNPKIIISASGMCEAGRIKHHLKHNLWNPKSSIIFVGYQAEGTLGKLIVDGAKDVMIMGEEIHVAAEIYNLEGFSGHADRDGLLDWLRGFQQKPHDIFLVHGEGEAKKDFAETVRKEIGYECIVVEGMSEYELKKETLLTNKEAMKRVVEKEQVSMVKGKLAEIGEELSKILYNTQLAVSDQITPEKMVKINNMVLELEKNTLNLGSAVTQNDEEDEDEKSINI
ncbi:MAG: MBL fold metallo-hydrolase [Anaerovorax sp.]